MKYSFNDDQWTWYKLDEVDKDSSIPIKNLGHYADEWTRNERNSHTNFLIVDTRKSQHPHLYGSLVYQQDIRVREDKKIFHFFLDQQFFLSLHLNLEEITSEHNLLLDQLELLDDALEGFLIVLSEILTCYLKQIDVFEERLHNLIWRIQEENNLQTLEQVYDTRHELLIWKNLIVPIKELRIGLEEAFDLRIVEKESFRRFVKKLERANTLLVDYQEEIDTMINLEEVVSSHRGNEIMKTLTVMTILFTPVAALGALWGMNFKNMPELNWPYGYVTAIVIILLSTLGLYFYLRIKGWTGDILKGKKKHKYFE